MTGPAASNLQPSDLHLNAYRSLPGGQDVFFSYFLQVFLSIGTLVSNLVPLSITESYYFCKDEAVCVVQYLELQNFLKLPTSISYVGNDCFPNKEEFL